MISVIATIVFGVLIFKAFWEQKPTLEAHYKYPLHSYKSGTITVSKNAFLNAGVSIKTADISSETWPAEAFISKKGGIEYLNVTKILTSPFAAQVRTKMEEMNINEKKYSRVILLPVYKFIAEHIDFNGDTTVEKLSLIDVLEGKINVPGVESVTGIELPTTKPEDDVFQIKNGGIFGLFFLGD